MHPNMATSVVPTTARPFGARGGALKMWTSREEEILLEGPAGTGKSRSLLEKIHFCAQKYAGMRGLIIRKTRESCSESVLVTFENKVVTPRHPCLEGPQRRLRSSYKYPNGSELIVGGMDKSGKIMSTEYDMICEFEATELTEEDHEALTTRLRNGIMPYQQIVSDCNPANPGHWLNQRAAKGKMQRILSRHEDNPTLHNNGAWTEFGAKYIRKLDRLSGSRYLRLRKGIWAASEGMVYDSYEPHIHLIDPFKIPSGWRKILSIDFGYKNPFVCQWWAIDPATDYMYRYREIYFSQRLVKDHALQIKAYSRNENLEAIISDHDAEDRATLHEAGIMTMPAHKAITPGIEAVQARLRVDEVLKKPKIFFFRDALVEADEKLREAGLPLCTEQEFENYLWPRTTEGKSVKEEPVKKDDHGMDTMRYAVAYADNVSAMSIRVFGESAVVVK